MAKMKTHEEFKEEVFLMLGKDFEILSKYKGTKKKVAVRHSLCGYEWDVIPTVLLKGKGCPKCNKTIKSKTTDYFKKEIYDLVGEEYSVLGKYVKSMTPIKMKHNSCGHEWEIRPGNFLIGKRCPNCKGGTRKNHKKFIKEVYEKYGEDFTVIGKYINAKTKIRVIHNICNYEYEINPDNLLRFGGCLKCVGRITKTHEEFVEELFDLAGDEYIAVGKYVNSNTKVKIKHNKCGYDYHVLFYDFSKGSRCPICNESKGEKRVRKILKDNSVSFESQYEFEDLVGMRGGRLRFDFAIIRENNLILVEYDGEFHFEKQYEDDNFERLQIHDSYKNNYCINNGIPLIRIPYWDFDNLENIINSVLRYFNIIGLPTDQDKNIIDKHYVREGWSHSRYSSCRTN